MLDSLETAITHLGKGSCNVESSSSLISKHETNNVDNKAERKLLAKALLLRVVKQGVAVIEKTKTGNVDINYHYLIARESLWFQSSKDVNLARRSFNI